MFKVELDVNVIYIPPMVEGDAGILMTRSFELPFAPTPGLRLFCRSWEFFGEPHGLELRSVVFDIERQVFLTTAGSIMQDMPIAGIPAELRDWRARGWRFGSYNDYYKRNDEGAILADDGGPTAMEVEVGTEKYEILHTLPPEEQPAEMKQLIRAFVRQMAVQIWEGGGGSGAIAYAMDKTGRYCGAGGKQIDDETALSYWDSAIREFRKLDSEQLVKWMQRIERYPSLASIVGRKRTPETSIGK